MITVVALGCKKDQLTLEGVRAIESADKIFVKTALTDTYEYFKGNNIPNVSLDFIYENSQDFDGLDGGIVEYLLKQEDGGNIVYCVNGSGYDDRSVIALAKERDIKIIPSVSAGLLANRPSVAQVTVSAYELVSMQGFNYDTRLSLSVTDVDNSFIAGEVKLVLQNILGDEEEVFFNGKAIPLFELDRQEKYDYSTAVGVLPKNLVEKRRFNFFDLYAILKILRGEGGCQWDRAQTHQSIRENAIEEAYELVDAINNDDLDNMIEECGDLMLQSVFHCAIAEDTAEFNTEDVLSGICEKLISRHTHIFGDVVANTPEEALKAWDAAKAKEKKYASVGDKIDKIAKSLPALMRAYKVQKAVAKTGFEFENFEQVLAKIDEEKAEYCKAKTADELEDEGGDLLIAVVNALRWKGVDPEVALSRSIEKFSKRFKYVETKCGNDVKSKSMEELDLLWEEAKVATKN
ncbi:MAG: nucleoside triphosphate pyrophosphohydrolase [Clostridia bacterium]|nr:nucleoside triphosphate pyrophosphohydrolase [Clostridia bacterium]MDE7329117.1 nucleoside triphosphate pyrophosphohydrolase [Clostridia bacterium]